MRIAFKMKLYKGFEEEYIKRHNEIWVELEQLLRSKGIYDYSIFLEEETGSLFGTLKVTDLDKIKELNGEPLMQRWWTFMKDIMSTNDDDSPVTIPLKEVFYFKK